MQSLNLEPPVPFVWPSLASVHITLVGCGGTGSHIAQTLAKLASHCQSTNGPKIGLRFIDGDLVEPKNVGRQLFSPTDVGKNKAQVLAARFSAVFGLAIEAVPAMLNDTLGRPVGYDRGVILGAVDNAQARQMIAYSLRNWGLGALWIDSGNHEHGGQVLVGTTESAPRLAEAFTLESICTELPSPALVSPELLVPAVAQPIRPEDCAAAVEDNRQSLLVNQMMATIACQYLASLLLEGRITTFETIVDLSSLSMRSTPITAANIARYCPQQQERVAVSVDPEEEEEYYDDDDDEL